MVLSPNKIYFCLCCCGKSGNSFITQSFHWKCDVCVYCTFRCTHFVEYFITYMLQTSIKSVWLMLSGAITCAPALWHHAQHFIIANKIVLIGKTLEENHYSIWAQSVVMKMFKASIPTIIWFLHIFTNSISIVSYLCSLLFSVGLCDDDKVTLLDFERLTVLGTGGNYRIVLDTANWDSLINTLYFSISFFLSFSCHIHAQQHMEPSTSYERKAAGTMVICTPWRYWRKSISCRKWRRPSIQKPSDR